jgi:hypothetical protein
LRYGTLRQRNPSYTAERWEELGDRSSLAPELFQVWSAVLDRRTCAFCFGKDGQVRALRESFGVSPPVHPNCRCIVKLVRVPRPERLEDIGIDYTSFKKELRDVIRERREESGRHAAAFISESMDERRRSPLVLAGRFRHLGPLNVQGRTARRRGSSAAVRRTMSSRSAPKSTGFATTVLGRASTR